jgi:hypothetical protein
LQTAAEPDLILNKKGRELIVRGPFFHHQMRRHELGLMTADSSSMDI